jgi:hypothetical protein
MTKIALFTAAALAATIIAPPTASARPTRGQAAPSTETCGIAPIALLIHPDPGRSVRISPSGLAHAGEERVSRYFGNVQRSNASVRGFAGDAPVIRASDLASAFAGTPVHGGEVVL